GRALGRAALELFFPPRCLVCGEVIERKRAVCDRCAAGLVPEPSLSLCPICGKPPESCVCGGERFAFVRCVSAFAYGPRVAGLIESLKRDPGGPAVSFLAPRMADVLQTALPDAAFDRITWVPMPAAEQARRGHNQAESLARALVPLLGTPCCEPPLLRREQSAVQHELSRIERAKNARLSYMRTPGKAISGVVLLSDDVATTCSTLDRCAALLRECGACQVFCLTAATTLLRDGAPASGDPPSNGSSRIPPPRSDTPGQQSTNCF
ncbi:MAG: double zinc ribbon domain-containing protein, partial [Oscillospiraceae bacterium]